VFFAVKRESSVVKRKGEAFLAFFCLYTGWRNVQDLIDSPLGNRWRLGYVDRLAVQDAGVLWVGGDGNLFWFYELPDDSYLAPEGQLRGSTLVSNADGTLTLADRHGGQSHFDQQGLLTSRQDRLGNATTFDYIDLDSSGVPDALSEMVEPDGRTTTFAYSDGRLQTSTDFAGGVTAMTYDAANRVTEFASLLDCTSGRKWEHTNWLDQHKLTSPRPPHQVDSPR